MALIAEPTIISGLPPHTPVPGRIPEHPPFFTCEKWLILRKSAGKWLARALAKRKLKGEIVKGGNGLLKNDWRRMYYDTFGTVCKRSGDNVAGTE